MMQSSGRVLPIFVNFHVSASVRSFLAISFCLITFTIAFVIKDQPFQAPLSSVGIYIPTSGVGLSLYALLFAALSLIAYRVRRGVHIGFQHGVILAAYLSLGPFPAFIATLLGATLAQASQFVFAKSLGLEPRSSRWVIESILFNTGIYCLPTLLGGIVLIGLGGTLPLIVGELSHVTPTVIALLTNMVVYAVIAALLVYRSIDTTQLKEANRAFALLMVGEILSLPLSLLIAISYYDLPPLAFLILVLGAVTMAILFRISEQSRRALELSRSTLEQRVRELTTINSIGQSITSSLAMNELMQSIYAQIARLMKVDVFYIALRGPEPQSLTFPFAMRNGQNITLANSAHGKGIDDYVLHHPSPLLLKGDVNAEMAKLGVDVQGENCASFLGVPLIVDDTVIGVMSVQSLNAPHVYGQSDVAVLSAIAGHAAVALHNANLYNRVWEMADELALLNNVSSVVTATLDLDIVLDTTCAVVIQIGHADKTAIFLTSEDGTTLRLVHSIGLSADYVAQFQGVRLDDDSGPTRVLRDKEPAAISDVRTDPRGLGWRSLAEVEGYVGLLAVPLTTNDGTLGFLAAFYQQPHLFGKSELDLMNTLANQVAVTVANARLYEDAQSRASEMARLVEASRAFTASLDLRSVGEKVLDELVGVFSPDMIALLIVDDNANGPLTLDGKANGHHNGSEHGDYNGLSLTPLVQRGTDVLEPMVPSGAIGQAIATCKADAMPQTSEDLALLTRLDMKSVYVLPLVNQEKVIAVVLVGHEMDRHLTEREQQLAEGLANQAAAAVRNAQLYSQTDAALADRIRELQAIEAISRKISGTLDLEAIINEVLDSALQITFADVAGCGLISDSDSMMTTVRYPEASGVAASKSIIKSHVGITGRVLRSGMPARIPDVQRDPDYRTEGLLGIRSELCVPIIHNEERLGVLNVESRRPDAFNVFHERFMGNLADHAAITIENARLFEERQIQIETLIKFRELSLALLSATSLRRVMDLIVEYTLVIAHAKDAHLYLYDADKDDLVFGASLWSDGRRNFEASRPNRGGTTWQVAWSGQRQFVENTTTAAQPAHYGNPPNFGAITRIPLKRAGQVLGVLTIAYRDPHYFTEGEWRALDLLANQSAIAIENIRLFDEVRSGRDRMQVILDSVRDGLLLIGANDELVLANPPAERLLNIPLQDSLGEKIMRVIVRKRHEAINPERLDPLVEAVHKILGNIKRMPSSVSRYGFQLIDGQDLRDIEAMVLPIHDEAGSVASRLFVLRDVTEEKSVERTRWERTTMVVHDLRAPLSAVISSLNLVQDMVAISDFGDLDQVISIAVNSSKTQMNMIQSILEIAKMETENLDLELSITPLRPLAQKAVNAIELQASSASVTVVNCVSADLPPLHIDEDQIRRVLVNLLDNALRFTPAQGQVRVEAAMNTEKNVVQIGIVDTGKGIAPEAREMVFEKFYQMPKAALRGHKGIGLGLTFCRLAVESHGGRIWVEDGPEGGAAFRFTLPLA